MNATICINNKHNLLAISRTSLFLLIFTGKVLYMVWYNLLNSDANSPVTCIWCFFCL